MNNDNECIIMNESTNLYSYSLHDKTKKNL